MKKALILILLCCLTLTAGAFDMNKVQNNVQLVNGQNYMESDYLPLDIVNLYASGIRVSATTITLRREAAIAGKAMFNAMSTANVPNYMVISGYRAFEKQQQLFTNKVNTHMKSGLTREAAEAEASTVVAIPGSSEHQTGYVMDISTTSGGVLNASQGKTSVAKWLAEHSYKYGYILRYPEDKMKITGIIYEPWHFRYVGAPHAQLITERKICLEEYIQLLKDGQVLTNTNAYGIDFQVSYTTNLDDLDISTGISVSKGDVGGYVVTRPVHNEAKTVFRWN